MTLDHPIYGALKGASVEELLHAEGSGGYSGDKAMIEIKRHFETGRVRPLNRGIVLDEGDGGIYLDNLLEEAIGDSCSYSGGAKLEDITIHITIGKAEKG